MLLKSLDHKFILVTSVLVLLMGVETFHSLSSEDLLENQLQTASSRLPASVRPVYEKDLNKPVEKLAHQDLKWDISCNKNLASATAFQVKTDYVQIQGRSCVNKFDQNRLTIVNQSNGFTASVFEIKNGQYETDLIQLKDGENKIIIRYEDQSGRLIEQTLSVVSKHI